MGRVGVHRRIGDFDLVQLVLDEKDRVGVAGPILVLDANFAPVIPIDAPRFIMRDAAKSYQVFRGFIDGAVLFGPRAGEVRDLNRVDDAA